MAEQVSGTPDPNADFINYALGQGWYQQVPELLNSINNGRQGRAAAGSGVLGHLTELLTNPGAGPLGMAATAAYGNNLLGATDGKGIDSSVQQSQYQTLLNQMLEYSGGVNASAEDAPWQAPKVDPNKAPALTPEVAAGAPNTTPNDLMAAWEGFNPGQVHPGRGGASSTSTVPGKKNGGKVELNADGSRKIPNAVDRMLMRSETITKAMKGLSDVSHLDDADGNGIPDVQERKHGGVVGYAEGGLVGLSNLSNAMGSDEEKRQFAATMAKLGQLNETLQGAPEARAQSVFDKVSGQFGKEVAGSGLYEPRIGAPDDLKGRPDFRQVAAISPDILRFLLGFAQENPANPADISYNFADGGGVTLAGKPHWIVDESGYPVAAITEDGAPENVRGLKDGGVEVTPLRPDRFEKYTGQAPGESDIWARMLARMNVSQGPALPGAATGQQFLFPDIPGSQVDTDAAPGSNQIPTWGGASAPIATGPSYGAGTAPKTLDDLFRVSGATPGANLNEKYARALGGSLGATNTNLGDLNAQLNRGGATRVSSQQFGSMNDSQRKQYTALLAAMGITPEDQQDFMQKTTPAGLG